MATFYVGYRPVLKGKNSNDQVHTWKNKKGTYSNWAIFNTSHVLDGAPDRAVSPGAGKFPHDLFMTQLYRGLGGYTAPLTAPGLGTRIVGARYRPLEYRGLAGQAVFQSGYGHLDRTTKYSLYSNYIFDGVPSADVTTNTGHARRAIGATGTAKTFGAFDPWINKGVTVQPLASAGQTIPTDYTNKYGKNKVLEWHGVASAKAL